MLYPAVCCVLLQVILGAYSQRLWDTVLNTSKQLRVAILDEKGRHEVLDLVEKIYQLAEQLVHPGVQLELCDKFGETYITPKVFMDYFNQVSLLFISSPLDDNPTMSTILV